MMCSHFEALQHFFLTSFQLCSAKTDSLMACLEMICCKSDDNNIPSFISRYMYTLARTQYTQAGSKNLKVRPVIPLPVLRPIRLSNAVKFDPLLNSSWVPLNEERVTRRLDGMLKEWVRRKRVAANDIYWTTLYTTALHSISSTTIIEQTTILLSVYVRGPRRGTPS